MFSHYSPNEFAMSNIEKNENPHLTEIANCPPVLYKYCSICIAEKIFQCGLRLSSVTSFNDPFDSRIIAKWPHDDEVIRQRVDMLIPNVAERLAYYQEALRTKAKYPDGNPPRLRKNVERLGVSCFSEPRDSILMWGHYANEHMGVSLGVRLKEMSDSLLLKKFNHVIKKIKYSNDFPEWEPGMDNEEEGKDIVSAMSIKASCWAYEKEWRIMALNAVKKHVPIPVDCVPCVIFGAKTSKEDEIRLCTSIFDNGYTPELLKVKISQKKYELEISPMQAN